MGMVARVNYAAIGVSSTVVQYHCSASAKGILPIGSKIRRRFEPVPHSSGANLTASKDRQGPRR
jgi:hypothetical protein